MTSIFLTMPKSSKVPQRSALGLLVLWQLFQGPMHVYRMQKLFQAQGKDRVVNLGARANLYQTLERLVRLGLVEVADTIRQEGYPDRVLYAITDAGRDVAREWLREMLRTTDGEYPEFIVAVSLLFGLSPDEARAELELRSEHLAEQFADTELALEESPPGLPRLFLLEEEYRKAVLEAQLTWVRGVIEDLRAKRLDWSEESLCEIAARFLPADQPTQPEGH
jgi:DNA-binding PadR family transcriptional regulator